MTDISVIIVSFNTKKLTLGAINSVLKEDSKVEREIIVVDNGSKDGSVEEIKKTGVLLIKNSKNLGFSKAVNQGIQKAKGKHVLLLNSDAKIKKGTIRRLVEFAEKKKKAGLVAPKLTDLDGSSQGSVFRLPTLARAIKQYWLGEKGLLEKYVPEGNNPKEVEAVSMACVLITQKALKEVGSLNENFFMYFEDLDYSRRVGRSGLKIYFYPKVEVYHLHGASGAGEADSGNQWRRLIPSSKIYHGVLRHYIYNFILFSGQKLGRLLPILFISLLTLPAIINLMRPGYFPMQDDLQAFRVHQMDRCFDDLQIPCRWVPDAGYQYGYPQFNYYPPLPYYIGALIHMAGFQYIDSVKILFIFGYFASSIAMYVLLKSLTSRWASIIGALLYTYVPYKAVEVYVRGAMSEFWAQIFFPLIFWASYKLIKTGRLIYLPLLSFFIAFLLTTHTLMSMIFLPLLATWVLYWLWVYKLKGLAKLISAGLLGFGISAFYILPVIFERKFAHLETLLLGYFDYRQHFVSLYKLFISLEWGYGSSGFPDETLNLSTGIVHWVAGILIVAFLAIKSYKRRKKLARFSLLFVIVTIGVLFLIHLRSSFIWASLPFLSWLQFPWRFLALSIFALSLLAGIAVYFSDKYRYVFGTVLFLISFILYIPFFVPKDWFYITDEDKFSGQLWEKQLTISIFDYLPIYATLPPNRKAPELPEILGGEAKFLSYTKGSYFQRGKLETYSDSVIRLPIFDFPGMEAKVDGKVLPHKNDDCRNQEYCFGLITLDVPKGTHEVEVILRNTPVRKAGNFLTLLSFPVAGIFILKSKRK